MTDQPIVTEDTFTRPHPGCPNPNYWHATDMQSTEIEVTELVAAFVRAIQPEYVVETGSCWGQTAQAIGEALKQNGHGRLVTLEPDERRAEFTRERCKGLPVTVYQVESLQFTPIHPIGFAWLDSLLELRVPEYHHLRPWMRPGTVVGFHDTAPNHGVYGDHVRALPGVGIIHLRTPRGVTFAQVQED